MAVATLGYLAEAGRWVVVPWGCDYPGRLTEAEARNALDTHGRHSRKRCRIRRNAVRMLSRVNALTSA